MAFVSSIPVSRGSAAHPIAGTAVSPRAPVALPRVSASSSRAANLRMSDEPMSDDYQWIDALEITDVRPGSVRSVVLASLEICIACDYDGQVYALGNKSPPLGVPLSDGSVVSDGNTSYVKCGQYGTLFDLSTGDVKESSWLRSPPFVSNVLRFLFRDPDGVPVYPLREMNGMLQVELNVMARQQYEEKYWKGLLDAQGKADGGYY